MVYKHVKMALLVTLDNYFFIASETDFTHHVVSLGDKVLKQMMVLDLSVYTRERSGQVRLVHWWPQTHWQIYYQAGPCSGWLVRSHSQLPSTLCTSPWPLINRPGKEERRRQADRIMIFQIICFDIFDRYYICICRLFSNYCLCSF